MATFSTTLGETITGNTSPSELQKPDNASLALEEIQTENFANCVFVFDDTEGVEKGTINQVLVDQKMKNKILITGADGFIGSHLTETLVRLGHDVKAFTMYNSFNSWGWLDNCPKDVKGKFEVFSGDIRDSHGVKKAMEGCDAVLHLAALIAIPYSYHSPDTYLDTNIKGTLNILQAAREVGVRRIIHTSTSEVYGTAQFVPITEKHPLQGQSPYSASKIGADQLAYSFFSSFESLSFLAFLESPNKVSTSSGL